MAPGQHVGQDLAEVSLIDRGIVENDEEAEAAAEGEAAAEAEAQAAAALAERAASQPVKDRLRANTDEAIARGAFGSPTIIVHEPAGEEQLYFGNDQLPLVRAKVAALA